MHVHPLIAALRSDPASQRRSQAAIELAMAKWRSGNWVKKIERDLQQFGQGEPLRDLSALNALMHNPDNAAECVAQFNHAVIDCLKKEPLGELPMRHISNAGFSRLQWMQAGGATLALCAYEHVANLQEPTVAQFADCETFEMIISGEARGAFHTLQFAGPNAPKVETKAVFWRAGDRIHRRASQDTRQVLVVKSSVLLLQLSRLPKSPRPTREFRLCDSALTNQASGDKKASEKLMALSVLGALKHRDGIGAMDEFATNIAHDLHARWEAVRQILAMDARCGMDLLERLAQRDADALAQPSRNLIEQLRQTDPALAMMQKERA